MQAIIQKHIYDRGIEVFSNSKVDFFKILIRNEEKILECQKKNNIKIIILDSKPFSDNFFKKLDSKTLIIRFGIGISNINSKICKKRGIKVANIKKAHIQSMVEHVIALIFTISKKIIPSHLDLKNNLWQKRQTIELSHKNLTILGLGQTGLALAKIAKKGFNMNICGYTRRSKVKRKYNHFDKVTCDLKKALIFADIVSLHFNGKKENNNFVNQDFLKLLKKDSILINAARGDLVDYGALYLALKDGFLAGAGLDVYPKEPYFNKNFKKHDLRKLNNVILTPHIASNTKKANQKTAKEVIKLIKNYK